MLWKCCTQYVSKFGKVSSGHRTGKGLFSFQSQRKAIPKNAQTTACWERLGVGGEGDDPGWDGWMASRTRWTWVWVNSGRWWWTGRPGVLQFMGSQRVGHDWATELNCTIALILHASKVMLKVLQARLQQSMNRELPDVQAEFRKGRGTRDQIASKRVPEKHLLLLYLLHQSLWLCGS